MDVSLNLKLILKLKIGFEDRIVCEISVRKGILGILVGNGSMPVSKI